MRIEKRAILFAVAATLMGLASNAYAGPIVAAVGVSSPQGDYGPPYDLVNSITWSSGLSQSYANGVTDFATLVSTATYDGFGGATNTFTGFPQYYLFDLGSPNAIDALGLWAEKIPGDGSPTSFSLYAGITTGAPFLGTFNSTGGQANAPGQAFYFADTITQFVLLEVLTTDGPLDYSPSIGQVVFDSVPEPSALALIGVALFSLLAFGSVRRRADA